MPGEHGGSQLRFAFQICENVILAAEKISSMI